MTTATGTLFLALLTIGAQAALVAAVVLRLLGLGSARVEHVWVHLRDSIAPHGVTLAFIVAAVATAGSLWLSEGAHFIPCKLCWYQRIAMYPLAPILLLAALRRDPGVRPYALAVAALAIPISSYHYLLERVPSLESGACDPTNPCTILWVWRFHYISIPLMAGTAFALIAFLLTIARPAISPPADTQRMRVSHGNA